MVFRLQLRFDSPAQLQAHLERYAEHGGVMIPERLCPGVEVPGPPGGVELEFVVGTQRAVASGQAVQRAEQTVVVVFARQALDSAWLLVSGRPRPSGRHQTQRGATLGRLLGAARRSSTTTSTPMAIEERIRPGAAGNEWDRWTPATPEPTPTPLPMPPLQASPMAAPMPMPMPMIDSRDLPPAAITPIGPSKSSISEAVAEWSRDEDLIIEIIRPAAAEAPGAGPPGDEASARTPVDEALVRGLAADADEPPPLPPPPSSPASTSTSPALEPLVPLTDPARPPAPAPDPAPVFAPIPMLPDDMTPRELLQLACASELGHQPDMVLRMVRHPNAPRALALRLLRRLTPAELAELAGDPQRPEVAAAAQRRLKRP